MSNYDPLEAVFHVTEPEVARLVSRRPLSRTQLRAGELGSSPEFWRSRRVLVTGSTDFLGELVLEHLHALGCEQVLVPRGDRYDLTRQEDVERLFRTARPDVVLHLAEQVGGIGANRVSPGRFFYENLLMGVLMIEEARRAGIEKFVQTGSITAYPRFTPVPFQEDQLWNGAPDPTNAPYGVAKRALLMQLQAYREQYGFNGIYLVPANLYGPRDDFDLQRSYVIPALIRKMVEAEESGADSVTVWGSGEATREFLFADDCARAVLLAAEHYEGPDPVNVGSGDEIKIRDLARLIAELTGFRGVLVLDRSRPEGQPRRRLDTSRAQQLFGFVAHTSLRDGLKRTIAWYREHRSRYAAPATPESE